MKRSAPLRRKTPMRRGAPLARDAKPQRARPRLRRPAMPKDVREAVYRRSGGRCDRCGVGISLESMEAHHRKLRAQGGQDDLATLIALCRACHVPGVHGHPKESRLTGFIVPSHGDPATVPVLRYTDRWYLPLGTTWAPTTPPTGDTP